MHDNSRRSWTHAYICECSNPSCREKLYLHPGDYERLHREGTVVHASCARNGRKVLRRFGQIVVVQTAWSRVGKPG